MKRVCQLLLLSLMLASCGDKSYKVIDNAVYFYDAQSSQLKKIATDDQERQFQVPIRASKAVAQKVDIEVELNPDYLETYNKQNDAELLMLPESMYSFNTTTSEIAEGEINAEQITLTVFPFTEEMISGGGSYALPMKLISKCSDHEVLPGSDNILYICDPVIVASAPVFRCTHYLPIDWEDPIVCEDWTFETKIRKTELSSSQNVNNQIIFRINGDTKTNHICFGDMGNKLNNIQFKWGATKIRGSIDFSNEKWYHLAVVKKGTALSIYVNGQLDVTGTVDEPLNWRGFTFVDKCSNYFKGTVEYSEARLWKVARTEKQLADNRHAVSPDSEGLVMYFKFNEGSGTTIKSYTDYLDDMVIPSGFTWKDGYRSDTWFD